MKKGNEENNIQFAIVDNSKHILLKYYGRRQKMHSLVSRNIK